MSRTCEECSQIIPEKRLVAIPNASLCVICQALSDKKLTTADITAGIITGEITEKSEFWDKSEMVGRYQHYED